MGPSPDKNIIAQLLNEAGIGDAVLEQAGDPGLENQIFDELEGISNDLPAADVGGPRVIIAGRFINLGEAAWKLVVALATLGISNLDPTGITKAVALKQALDFLKELRPLVKKLDQAKLLVCSAIATVSAEKKRRAIAEPGASEQDIIGYFSSRGESTPIKLADILKALQSDQILNATNYRDSGPYYSIKF